MASTKPSDDFARVDYVSCKKYTPGHQVHFIQARKSREGPAGEAKVIEAVDDDGTIRFTDGTTKWNHDARRVRALFEHAGPAARLRGFNVLAIGSYLVCVGDEPGSCDDRERLPGESIGQTVARRGGVFLPGRELLAQLGIERPSDSATGPDTTETTDTAEEGDDDGR